MIKHPTGSVSPEMIAAGVEAIRLCVIHGTSDEKMAAEVIRAALSANHSTPHMLEPAPAPPFVLELTDEPAPIGDDLKAYVEANWANQDIRHKTFRVECARLAGVSALDALKEQERG